MFAAPRPALSADAQAAIADHDTYGPWTGKAAEMSEYQDMFSTSPVLANAMDYASLHADIRSAFWTALYDAEVAGGVADVSDWAHLPTPDASGQSSVNATAQESADSCAAKLAHAFYLERNQLVPWRITDWDEWTLRGLLDPQEIFTAFQDDLSGGAPGNYQRFCDHSPWRMHSGSGPLGSSATGTLAQGGGGAAGALSRVLDGMCGQFHHSGGADYTNVVAMGAAWADKVARSGCHFAGRLASAAARSINIPAYDLYGWWDGGAHQNTIFPSLHMILHHGDYVYNVHGNGLEKLDAAHWGEYLSMLAAEPDSATRRATTRRMDALRRASAATQSDVDIFVDHEHGGWSELSNLHHEFLSLAELDTWYSNLSAVSGDIGHKGKPSAGNSGFGYGSNGVDEGALTATSGTWNITATGSRFHVDHTGPVVIDGPPGLVAIVNCRINGNGNTGITTAPTNQSSVYVWNTEVTGCGAWALSGDFSRVEHCYVHGNNGGALDLLNTGGSILVYGNCVENNGLVTTEHMARIAMSGTSYLAWVTFNTIDAPHGGGNNCDAVFRFEGTSTGASVSRLDNCWLNGGQSAVIAADVNEELQVTNNKFGRDSTVALTTPQNDNAFDMWDQNTYEDDGSNAYVIHTAPL